ncbi:MAG TPA: agglutinin biogenesis protein MshI [Noviherbaspirillum sp.]|uniref:type IV pilus biogenesis protein PilM n=1 Tax=Noviherbaspirillum sp. TaxID=1926288 RepID=UPI002D3EFF7D|nr:agglutinin biogenesis protein MshI [Noviherbaspirillum sp.]HYD96055.1 agglutinin biogenesis protein MshI [Noviherbaspirillum sp.]
MAFYPAEKEAVQPALEKLAKELHTQRYRCTSLLGAGEYQLLSVDAPAVPQDELKTAIRWRLKDMLDFHVDDATIDVVDVPVEKNAPARNHSMYAVAARNQLIEQRQGMFVDAKIPLKAIDIPEMAQRNLSALLEPEGRGVAMLSFDDDGGLLTVTFSGELYLARRLDVTLAQLSQEDGEQRHAIHDRITLELQRSLDHFDRQYHFIPLAKLVLGPFHMRAAGLQEYLASNLYVPVEKMDLESVLDLSKVSELRSADAQQRYFLTLGAALRHEEKML